jgi:hypothetical protein
MAPFRLIRHVAVGLLVLAGIARLETAVVDVRAASASFLSDTGPRQVRGDFDGDGRLDVAVIRHDRSGSSIAILLAGSVSRNHLPADIAGLVPVDIDHDGDLDLVGLTKSGKLVIWLNDGHGRFARQRAHHQKNQTNVTSEVRPTTLVVMAAPVPAATPLEHHVVCAVIVTAPPHAAQRQVRLSVTALPTLRAPPLART